MWQMIHDVVRQAWQQFSTQVVQALPNVLASLLTLILGLGLGLLARIVLRRVFSAADLDRRAERVGLTPGLERLGIRSLSTLLSRVVTWVIILLALVLALYSLDAALASTLLSHGLLYVPNLVVAAVILIVGLLVSRFLARSVLIAAVNHELGGARLLAGLTRIGIMLVTVAMALEHLGIGRLTVLVAFAIVFGGVTFAAALAVGLGSRGLVERWLEQQWKPPSDATPPDDLHHV